MAIYDVSGGEITSVDNAAKLKLYPWPVILGAADLTTSAAGAGVLQGDVFTLSGGAGVYAAFGVPVSEVESQMVRFRAGCTALTGGAKLVIAGVKKNSTESAAVDLCTLGVGSVEQDIDLAWYDVYSTLDMAKAVSVRIVLNAAGSSVTLNAPELCEKFMDCAYVDEGGATLGKALENVQTAIQGAASGFDGQFTAPDGSKYILQVSAAGEAVFTPVVPSKALFIGNSLLVGFGQFGMCASNAQSDYYYHVTQAITALNASFTAAKAGGTAIEAATDDDTLDTAYNNIASKVTNDLDLIIVQLSDNTNSTEKIAYLKSGGAKRLLSKLRTAAPHARVVWAAAWYTSTERLDAIQAACAATGCEFIPFNDLNTAENRGAIGNTITYPDGNTSTVEASGVASHPGDAGMLAIAQRILKKLGIN